MVAGCLYGLGTDSIEKNIIIADFMIELAITELVCSPSLYYFKFNN